MGRYRFIFAFLFVLGSAVLAVASCAKPVAVPTCTTGQSLCDGVCVATNDDSDNCGKCGNVCPMAQACVKGACSVECPGGSMKCGKDGGAATCVNGKTDNQNCGTCGNVCKPGEVCYGGNCNGTCGDSKSGETMCGADAGSPYCANLKADGQNCGTCGNVCTAGKLCVAGVCKDACDSDQTLCNADAGSPYCADLKNDNANCGACGVACSGALSSCLNGTCGSLCGYGQIMCGADAGTPYCVDALSDNKNCGTCGNVCPSNNPLCSGGKCTTTGGGTVRFTNGNIVPVTFVKCGNGTNTNCNESTAETSCTSIGLKLVSHASNGTSAVVSLGATASCYFSISYFTNNNGSLANQCLVGVSNAQWTSCCGTSSWHGNTVTVPATLGQQFGWVSPNDSGYNGTLSNVDGTHWGCQSNATAVPVRSGCTTYWVACM